MRHPTRWAGAYALVAVMLASVFAVAILAGPYRAVQRSDYMTYHVAARIVVEARGDCLYSVDCQARVQRDLIGEEPSFGDGALPFTSPPWLALLVVPLVPLSLAVAFAIFTVLSVLLLGMAAWRLAWGGAGTRLVATALVLSAWPTVMAAIRGQASLGVAAVLGLSAGASLVGAEGRAGVLAGVAAFKPTLLALWGIRLVVDRRWRALAAAAAVVVLLGGLAAVVVSPKAVADYPAYLLNLAGSTDTFGIHVEQMINWRGAAERLHAGVWLVAGGSVATLGLVAVAWLRSSSRYLGAAAAFLATPLVIPHANQHEFVLATLGILLAVVAVPELRRLLATLAIGTHALLWVGVVPDAEVAAWLLFGVQVVWLVVVARLSGSASTADRHGRVPLPIDASE
jgi:hypothetical protein